MVAADAGRWTRFENGTIVKARRRGTRTEKIRRYPMGDKGGKKDKMKDQKQKTIKQQQETKRKLDKQPPKKP